MPIKRILLALSLWVISPYAHSAGLVLSDSDCQDILARWNSDPASVPQQLVDTCRGQIASAAGAVSVTANQTEESVSGPAGGDPCGGPNAANSVFCWGRWSVLAPAAGGAAGVSSTAIEDPRIRPELAEELEPQLTMVDPPIEPPVLAMPLGSCGTGVPCGFATLTDGLDTVANGDETTTARFDLQTDGSQFTVDSGGNNQLVSNDNMVQTPSIGLAKYESVQGDTASQFIAELDQNGGDLNSAYGFWKHGQTANQTPDNTNSGVFVWGLTSSQATLDSLNNGGADISVAFSGVMLGDTTTATSMTVNFGAQPDWVGNWSNTTAAFDFSAGGNVVGVDLISDPTRFSGNVIPDQSFIQGVLFGELGDQSIGHVIDVTLTDGRILRDAGRLTQD